ncbi:MAG: hemerythrin domain-containing protein [Dehalococcoidales bacterium]|nr:hemerythrin domain-containing protein [Dehalococcoidales bacterium]
MVYDSHCPGSQSIRNPVPENIPCPQCGREVEIWTDEKKGICPGCKTTVFRERKMSCIDWCPYAKECVGPEVYERLKPAEKKDSTAGTPLELLKQEHDRVLETIALLRGVNLCLKFSSLGTESPLQDRGLNHLRKIIEFFDKDVTLHFRREEEVLFPALEKHIDAEKSPAKMLLREHDDWRGYYIRLKEIAARMEADGAANTESLSVDAQEVNGAIEHLLREHIKKENESLLPLARNLLSDAELKEISEKWRALGNQPASP